MRALINGEFGQQLAVDDRGLLYGQSLFETIAISNGQACLLEQHLARLERSARLLAIPVDIDACRADIAQLAEGQNKAVIRLTLSMGSGGRGYKNPATPQSVRIASLHSYPEHPKRYWQTGIELGVAQIRLASQPALAGIKHGNRLEQVIARSQWQDSWQEALLLDQHDHVIEATQANVFIVANEALLTPELLHCGVAGVMRDFVVERAEELGLRANSVSLSMPEITRADAVFVCNSVIGLWPIRRFGDQQYTDFSISKKLLNLMTDYGAIPST